LEQTNNVKARTEFETAKRLAHELQDASKEKEADEALTLGSASAPYQAAQSLSNYRDLYRLYRSDADLQAVHELFPIIAIQDDHEFSDDCHADVATYTDGRMDETETPRRLAADQAWFEYMPVDLSQAPTSDWDATQQFPDELRYYRNFEFGRHLDLVLTDLRRYRPDHLVPEDAFPGSVFLTQTELTKVLGSVPANAFIDAYHVPTVGVSLANYDDNQHTDNENLRLGNLWHGILTLAAIMTK